MIHAEGDNRLEGVQRWPRGKNESRIYSRRLPCARFPHGTGFSKKLPDLLIKRLRGVNLPQSDKNGKG